MNREQESCLWHMDHMTKMAVTSIYGRKPFNIVSHRNQRANATAVRNVTYGHGDQHYMF